LISEIKNARAGYGQARFIIRGSSFLPLDRAAILRPAYDEYPERYPLEPEYPQAGRRSGSRPPATRVAGAGAGAGGPEDLVRVPPGSIYPMEQIRTELPIGLISGGIAGAASSGGQCVEVGDTLRNSPQVPATGGIRSFSTRRIPRPFVITHLQYWGSNTVPSSVTDLGLTIFIADDGNVSLTALVSSGRPLDFWEGGPTLEPFSVVTTHYPNLVISEAGKFIKMQWVNNNAAALETMLAISWKYI
jgi:hypothetical protein